MKTQKMKWWIQKVRYLQNNDVFHEIFFCFILYLFNEFLTLDFFQPLKCLKSEFLVLQEKGQIS